MQNAILILDDQDPVREQLLQFMLTNIRLKDSVTYYHSLKVRQYAVQLAEALKLDKEDIDMVSTAALLHDIGKVAIKSSILKKPGKLTKAEMLLMKKHPAHGYEYLINCSDFRSLARIVLHHHERFDGKGYPGGLKHDNIPVTSRILALADAYDAMTNYRVYRQALSQEEAVGEILCQSGTQFDPDLSQIFIDSLYAR